VTVTVRLPPPAVDPEQVRRVVEEVLSRPEYEPIRPSLVERVGTWFAEMLGRLLESVGGGGDLVAWIVILLVLGVALGLGGWLVRSLRPDRPLADPLGGPVRKPEDWASDAELSERAGEWREALRCRYRALIAELAAAGLVEETPGRTTGEYLAEIRRELPEAAAPAAALSAAFDAVWYGNAPAGPGEVAALRADADEVRRRAAVDVR
jgi:hypothetical protein